MKRVGVTGLSRAHAADPQGAADGSNLMARNNRGLISCLSECYDKWHSSYLFDPAFGSSDSKEECHCIIEGDRKSGRRDSAEGSVLDGLCLLTGRERADDRSAAQGGGGHRDDPRA